MKKILVAEDEHPIAEYVQTLLELNGFKVQTAADGKEAVEKARKFMPDLVLLDIMMPKLNGYEVCKLLKSDPSFQEVPIIMLTSMGQIADVDKAFALGAKDYIVKPFDAERLLQKVKKALGL